ncbi:peptidylprolyl isomerase [candidate division KSB1 bacterium]
MVKAKEGDRVKVHFNLKSLDGTLVDSSYEKEPAEFCIGSKQAAEQFENAALGLEVGEKRIRLIVDAFGQRKDEMVLEVDRGIFPQEMELTAGQKVNMQIHNNPTVVEIVELSEDRVKIDTNHPFAGKDFLFECELISIG